MNTYSKVFLTLSFFSIICYSCLNTRQKKYPITNNVTLYYVYEDKNSYCTFEIIYENGEFLSNTYRASSIHYGDCASYLSSNYSFIAIQNIFPTLSKYQDKESENNISLELPYRLYKIKGCYNDGYNDSWLNSNGYPYVEIINGGNEYFMQLSTPTIFHYSNEYKNKKRKLELNFDINSYHRDSITSEEEILQLCYQGVWFPPYFLRTDKIEYDKFGLSLGKEYLEELNDVPYH